MMKGLLRRIHTGSMNQRGGLLGRLSCSTLAAMNRPVVSAGWLATSIVSYSLRLHLSRRGVKGTVPCLWKRASQCSNWAIDNVQNIKHVHLREPECLRPTRPSGFHVRPIFAAGLRNVPKSLVAATS